MFKMNGMLLKLFQCDRQIIVFCGKVEKKKIIETRIHHFWEINAKIFIDIGNFFLHFIIK